MDVHERLAQVGRIGIQLEEALPVIAGDGSAHLWIMHVLDVRAIFCAACFAAMYIIKAVFCRCMWQMGRNPGNAHA